MPSLEEEAQIAENHALLDWARQAPEQPWGWDDRPTEEQVSDHMERVRAHYDRRPDTSKDPELMGR